MISSALLQFLREQEGWSATPYQDVAGNWTIGYGHLLPDGDHPAITRDYGEILLLADAGHAQAAALQFSPTLAVAAAPRLDAITDFCFNLGGHKYAGSTLRQYVNTADWTRAAEEIQKWCHAGGKVVAALVKRRLKEAQWLVDG